MPRVDDDLTGRTAGGYRFDPFHRLPEVTMNSRRSAIGSLLVWGLAIVVSSVAGLGWRLSAEPLRLARLSLEVAFELRGNHVLIPVRLGSGPELRLVLDSGVPSNSVMLFHRDVIEESKLQRIGVGRIPRVADTPEARAFMEELKRNPPSANNPPKVTDGVFKRDIVVRNPGITLAGASIAGDAEVLVLDTRRSESLFDADGLIGYALLKSFVTEIDYDARRLRLHRAGEFDTAGWDAIPLRLTNGFPVITVRVAVEAQPMRPLALMVDLGNGGPLILHRDPQKVPRLPARTIELTSRGLAGARTMPIGRVALVGIGDHVVRDVVAGFLPGVDVPGTDGNLGNALLRRFNVAFDYGRGVFYVKPNAQALGDFDQPLGGLRIVRRPGMKWELSGVVPGSPAERAGLAAGDRITKVDGVALDTLSHEVLDRLFGEAGRALRLTVTRGSRALEVLVRLDRVI